MTNDEFNALDEMEQAEAVWDSVHISDRQDADRSGAQRITRTGKHSRGNLACRTHIACPAW